MKISLIPASSQKVIYVYYGNPTASDASSPGDVFEFFDDFNTYSGWSGDVNQFDITSLAGENVLYVKGWGYPGWIYKRLNETLTSYVVECLLRDESDISNNPHPGVIIAGSDGNNWNAVYMRASSNQIVGSTTTNGVNWFGYPVDYYLINEKTWYKVEAIVVDGSLKALYINETKLNSFNNWDVKDSLSIVGLIHYGLTDGPGYYDKLRVRKYTEPEPSVLVGQEEISILTIGPNKTVKIAIPIESVRSGTYTLKLVAKGGAVITVTIKV